MSETSDRYEALIVDSCKRFVGRPVTQELKDEMVKVVTETLLVAGRAKIHMDDYLAIETEAVRRLRDACNHAGTYRDYFFTVYGVPSDPMESRMLLSDVVAAVESLGKVARTEDELKRAEAVLSEWTGWRIKAIWDANPELGTILIFCLWPLDESVRLPIAQQSHGSTKERRMIIGLDPGAPGAEIMVNVITTDAAGKLHVECVPSKPLVSDPQANQYSLPVGDRKVGEKVTLRPRPRENENVTVREHRNGKTLVQRDSGGKFEVPSSTPSTHRLEVVAAPVEPWAGPIPQNPDQARIDGRQWERSGPSLWPWRRMK